VACILRERRQAQVQVQPDNQDGYFGPDVSETAKGNSVRDLKEFFHVYPWGQYPTEVSDAAFRYRDQATEIAKTLLGWVEDNTPPEVAAKFSRPLNKMLDGSTRTLLRILRYPPLSGDEEPGAVRARRTATSTCSPSCPRRTSPGLQVRDVHGKLARRAVRLRQHRDQRGRHARARERWLLPVDAAPGAEPDR
jgi:hypothetical protein